jgi:predicted metal-dependent hydrolase
VFRYNLIFSRRRTISISVSPDKGVTVRAPLRTSPASIEKFVASRSDWVMKHLENFNDRTRLNGKIADGEKILFRGRELIVRLSDSRKAEVTISEGEVFVGVPAGINGSGAELVLKKWISAEAAKAITFRVKTLLSEFESYGFKPSIIKIRTMKRRWGSCSSKGRITLNSELIKLDDIFTDYVILHELCHLKHHNHGAEYYKLLSEVFPDWKNVRKELRKFLS